MTAESKVEKRSGEKREKILKAAQKLLTQYGFQKTSIDEIANLAGIGKGTFYLYFASKEDLAEQLFLEIGATLRAQVLEAIEGLTDPEVKLRALIKTYLRMIREWTAGLDRSSFSSPHHDISSGVARLKIDFNRDQTALLKGVLEEGQASRVFSMSDPEFTASMILHSMRSFSHPWNDPNLDNLEECLCKLLLNGLMDRSHESSAAAP